MPDTAVARSVLSLDEALDERLVGGKAAGLSRLIRLGVAVPRAIVVPAAATVRFDADRVPDDIWPEIVDAWRALDAPVAIVRSSAVGEDSADASFAGQLDSIPDVTNEEELRAAILQCWRSRGSDRVRAYQRARGPGLGGLGIIIPDKMASSMSGVFFTIEPGRSGAVLFEFSRWAGR